MTVPRIPFRGNVPRVGDWIYVPSARFISRGRDDRQGGLAQVTVVKEGISAGKPTLFVTVEPFPHLSTNWSILAESQLALAKEFGQTLAAADPDYRSEFNQGW